MENIEIVKKCPLCESEDSTLYAIAKSVFVEGMHLEDTFNVVKCSRCGFVHLGTRPTKEYITNYYRDDHAYYEPSDKNSTNREVHKTAHDAKKVLDIGFGNCDALLKKSNEGWDCYGVDLSSYAVINGSKLYPELTLKQGTLQDAKYPDNFFDLIIMSHVLEHDYDPVFLMKEVRRILKKGGLVVIDIPNFGGLYYSLFGINCEFFVPHHLSFFTRKTLTTVIENAGFTDFRIKNIFGNSTAYHILHALGIQKTYYKKSIFNKLIGLCTYPIETTFQKGDALRAFLSK